MGANIKKWFILLLCAIFYLEHSHHYTLTFYGSPPNLKVIAYIRFTLSGSNFGSSYSHDFTHTLYAYLGFAHLHTALIPVLL